MSVVSKAKIKAAQGNVKEAFTNEQGAIDLASIMVGIIVIGLIGGVIAATVFAVIPWAQDNAAKQQLDSVAAAQSAYVGLSADVNGGSKTSFGGATILTIIEAGVTSYEFRDTNATTLQASMKSIGNDGKVAEKLFDGTGVNLSIGSIGTGSGAHYAAAIKSSSGNVFYITDTKTQPTNDTKAVESTKAKTWVKVVVDKVS